MCNCKPISLSEVSESTVGNKRKRIHKLVRFEKRNVLLEQTVTLLNQQIEKTESVLFFENHVLSATFDNLKRFSTFELDGIKVQFEDGFWRNLNSLKSISQFKKHYKNHKLEHILEEISKTTLEPTIITFLLHFANHFSHDLKKSIHAQAEEAINNTIGARYNFSDISTGCSENGFCGAEFSSCEECHEDIIIWETIGGGGGGGGIPDNCVQRWLLALQFCERWADIDCESHCQGVSEHKVRIIDVSIIDGKPIKNVVIKHIEPPVWVDEGEEEELDLLYYICIQSCARAYDDCIKRAEMRYWDCFHSSHF